MARLTPHFKIALRAILLRTQPNKMPYHSQIFARKPDQRRELCEHRQDPIVIDAERSGAPCSLTSA